MERKKKFYSDILISIDLIHDFTKGVSSFDAYSSDAKTKSAVERQLVIIGEAINHLSKLKDEELIHAKQIISFRNRLVHAYDSIDDTIVWLIVKKYLSDLKLEVISRNK